MTGGPRQDRGDREPPDHLPRRPAGPPRLPPPPGQAGPRQTPPRHIPPRHVPPGRSVPPAGPPPAGPPPAGPPPAGYPPAGYRRAPEPGAPRPRPDDQPTQRIGDRIPLSPRGTTPRTATPPANTPRLPKAPDPPEPPKPRKPRRKRHWGRIIVGLLLVTVLLLVGAVVAVGVSTDRALHHVTALTDYPGRPAYGSGTTWLLVGSDSRRELSDEQQSDLSTGGDTGDGRTDTILLVHLPAFGSDVPATMVSIPRDSYVPIPGYGRDKINAAFSLGGAPLLTQTVEQATGLRLDHYAEIGFGGFAGVVDALGGVTVCPVEPVDDPLAGLNLPAGCQNLGGSAALGYVRSRATPRADLDRMVHQREFLTALLHRAAEPSVWLNPGNWTTIPQAVAAALTVDTDSRVWHLTRLGWALRDAATVTVPIGEYTWADAGQVVIWDHQRAAELFEALGADQPIPQSALDDQP